MFNYSQLKFFQWIGLSILSLQVYSQCPNNNTFLANLTPGYSGDTVYHNCVQGGKYITTNVEIGNDYVFSTCGHNGFNTQMTLRNSSGTVWYGYNDNFCGQQSQITWTATFNGTVRLLMDASPGCAHNTICQKVFVTKRCLSDAGTYNIYKNGSPTSSPVYLCEGQDTVEIISNMDYVLPPAESGEISELMYMVFNCQPNKSNPALDSCFTGVYLKDKNFIDPNPGVLATGVKYYLLPVTVDDGDNGSNPNGMVNLDANGDSCYSTGDAIELYYLSPLAFASNIDCGNKAVDISIFGGKSAYDSSFYSIVNTGSGNISGLPVAHGGMISITGLENGDLYSFQITDVNGCSNTFSGGPLSLPNAGKDSTYTFCSIDGAFDLDSMLVGKHDSTGSWYNPSLNPSGSLFTPGSSQSGNWSYVINGFGVCPDDTAHIQVHIDTLKNAGNQADTTICQFDSAFPLDPMLNSGADTGGSWYTQGNVLFSGVCGPNNNYVSIRRYFYKVNVGTACPVDSSRHRVFMNKFPNPGRDSAVTFCDLDTGVSFIENVPGYPDTGGVWLDPGNNPVPGAFVPYTNPPGPYTYRVFGQAPCPDTSITLLVSLAYSNNPGNDSSVTFCRNDTLINLVDYLSGSPDISGIWIDPNGDTLSTGFADPASAPSGNYKYQFIGNEPCPDTSANLMITFIDPPDPGDSDSLVFCSTNGPQNLLSIISGTPESGGQWYDPFTGMFSGTFNPSVNIGGVYSYHVQGTSPCSDSLSTHFIHVTTAPKAGGDTALSFCTNDSTQDFLEFIPQPVDSFGYWKDPFGNIFNMPFIPSLHVDGIYSYTVSGSFPCQDDTSRMLIDLKTAPNSGLDGSLFICSSDSAVSLYNYLNGSPDLGGAWKDSAGNTVGGTFYPKTNPGGKYSYTVAGTPPCSDSTSYVNVFVSSFANPGLNSSASICSDEYGLNLLSLMNGNPDTIGNWRDPNGLPHSGLYNPSNDVSGLYVYTVAAFGSCSDSSASLNLNITSAPNPGIGDTLLFCSSDSLTQLFNLLISNPDSNGNWLNPSQQSFSGLLNPSIHSSGLYSYTITANSPCSDSSSYFDITINPFANAGKGSSRDVCDSDSSFDLFTVLSGNPDSNGIWRNVNQMVVSSVFNPSTQTSGVFSYTINGIPPCQDSTAHAMVSVVREPDPGMDTAVFFCNNMSPINLLSLVPGQPDPGGSWKKPSMNPFNGILDPGMDSSGTYSYTVQGQNPCPDRSSFVDVTINELFLAGNDESLVICENVSPFNFLDVLSGDPDFNGQWTLPNGDPFDGLSSSIKLTTGIYKYITPAEWPCPADSSQVDLVVRELPNAGKGIPAILCESDLPLNLGSKLSQNPDSIGYWINPNGGDFGGIFDPSSNLSGTYVYIVPGQSPCPDDSAYVDMDVLSLKQAGEDQLFAICWNLETTSLSKYLNESSNEGGLWLNKDKKTIGGLFRPNSNPIGRYYYVIPEGVCPPDTAAIQITLTQPFDVYAGTDISLVIGQRQRLKASSQYAIKYHWKPETGLDRPDVSSPVAFPETTTLYIVSGFDHVGCESRDSVLVRVLPNIFIPNSFTPNRDGVNDEWYPEGLMAYETATIRIFSHDRQEVFRSSTPGERWNGTYNGELVPPGPYIYIIDFGNEIRFEKIRGSITLIR